MMLMPSTPTQLRICVAAPKEEHPELPMLCQIAERNPATGVERPIFQLGQEEMEDMMVLGLNDLLSCARLMRGEDKATNEQFWLDLSDLFQRVAERTEDRG